MATSKKRNRQCGVGSSSGHKGMGGEIEGGKMSAKELAVLKKRFKSGCKGEIDDDALSRGVIIAVGGDGDCEGGESSSRKRRNGTKESSTAAPNLDSVFWEVESVHGRRQIGGRVHYLIKWKGYSMDECTWEPQGAYVSICDQCYPR